MDNDLDDMEYADGELITSEFVKELGRNITDPDINTVFSNRVLAILQDSDILLYFGIDRPSKEILKNEIRYSTCVAMSHAYFMQTMEYLMARYNALRELYDYPNSPLSFPDVLKADPERHERAWKLLNVIPKPKARTDDTDKPSKDI